MTETVTVQEEMYELTRDGKTYSVEVEAECEMQMYCELHCHNCCVEHDSPDEIEVSCQSVEISDIHVYLEELGTVENGWDCEVKGFEFTKQELKDIKDFLAAKAENETNVFDYI